MDEHIDLQFRPSLMIFVGEAGKGIHQYFGAENLLTYLDETLRQSVGLLQIETEGRDADPDYAQVLASGALLQNDPDSPTGKGPLEDTIYRSLASVQLERRRLAMNSAGYAVPDPRTQIYIVGELTDENIPWMAKILRIVREQIRQDRFDTMVCYVLNSYKVVQDYTDTLKKPWIGKGLKWNQHELANFSYLYEHMITHPFPTFLSPDEARYASAEALFALAATGISSSSIFENEMQLSPNLENYSQHVGSLTTSMVMFPRKAVSRYSSARLSSELMQKWSDDLGRSDISDQERRELQKQARSTASEIVNWISDSVPRPEATESLWPTLAILREKHAGTKGFLYSRQLDAHRQLGDQTRELFRNLSFHSVSNEYGRQKKKTETWSAIAYKRYGKAVDAYASWEMLARGTWEAANERIGDNLSQKVNSLWPVSNNGFEQARMYVVELDNCLRRLADMVTQWRTQHYNKYEEDISHFLQLAEDGPWTIVEDEANIKDEDSAQAGQARPTMGGQGPVASTNSQSAFSGSGTSAGAPSTILQRPRSPVGPQHPSLREEGIALNLGRRIGWKQKQVPSVASLGATSFLGWLTTVFALSMFPIPAGVSAAADLGVALAFLAGNVALRLQRRKQMSDAQEDLLQFYRRHYTFYCEKREDLQRMSLMMTLRGRVTRMRDRLEDMYNFILNSRNSAAQEAVQVENELFNSPAGVRDIFVGNGERLEQHGAHTLDAIVNQVTQLRLNQPIHDWHRTLDEMKDELIRTLRSNSVSLIEVSDRTAQEQIYNFTATIVNSYLTGSLVDIGQTLDKPEIWRAVLDRIGKPLYFAKVGIRDPRLMFICGSKKDLNKSKPYIPGDAITVETKSTEWLMAVAFFRGGEPTAIDADRVFLPKVVATRATVPLPPTGNPQSQPDPKAGSAQQAFIEDDTTTPRRIKPSPSSARNSSSQGTRDNDIEDDTTTPRRIKPSPSSARNSGPQGIRDNDIDDDSTDKR